ncbi:restriction endonuclease subunit S [Enterococcus gallinarum]|uniref:restriction endonuclease subunit S n=1 Tax=Enterococcus gallinarum TaxID=1353 RepID=UPI0028918697|nr:restriction endonuclease subunit S [Enterococcus gallinarum]MDT2712915.1 restriction endonuclease subunit S [Enterococcus gallinarum]
MTNKNMPEIRFPGFTEEWEQRKSSDLMSFSNGINAPKENYGKGRKMISVMDILDEQPIKYETIRNSVEVDKKVELNNKVEYGDLVFVRSSEVSEEVGWAKAYLEKEYALYSGFSIRGKKIKEFNPHFVELSLNSVNRKQIERKAGGSTRFNVSQNVMNSLEILMPKFEEQNKIDRFFKQLDDTIALHQREIELLKETKKGFLQKMFPREGEKVPEIRFPGFTEEWEQRKFKEFSKKTGKKNSKDLDFPAYSVSNKAGLISQTEQFDGSRLDNLEKTTYKFVEPNEFAYNPARINVGSIAFNNLGMTVIVSSLYVVVKMSEDLDNEFILQFIKSPTFIKEVKRNTEGSVREYLFYENFANIKFPFTRNKEEQQKIGNFFKQLDDTIALHQRELDLLKEAKKGFLQKLFV